MNTLKYRNMLKAYAGFPGEQTIKAIHAQIPEELFTRLTGRELGLVMSAISHSYQEGKHSQGAEVFEGSTAGSGKVWIDILNNSLSWGD